MRSPVPSRGSLAGSARARSRGRQAARSSIDSGHRPWSSCAWLARSSTDLPAFVAAVESYFAVPDYGEEALVDSVGHRRRDAVAHQGVASSGRPDAPALREGVGSGRGNGTAVRALAAVLEDGDPAVREAGAGPLGRIGPTAGPSHTRADRGVRGRGVGGPQGKPVSLMANPAGTRACGHASDPG